MTLSALIKGLESESSADRSSRNITIAYILALLLIALLSTSMHYLLSQGLRQQEDAATVVNVAGRQRMLSQRIALLADDVDAGIDSARTALADAADLMERSQNALVNRNDLGISSHLSPAASSYYFDGPAPLDEAVRKFVGDAHRFLKMAPGEDRHKLELSLHQTALSGLLPALDRAVSIFAGEANEHVSSTLLMQNVVFVTLLLTLVAEAFFIFRPVISTVRDHANKLYILATRDSLTSLPNHRFFIDTTDRLIRLARRSSNHKLAALVIDIDHFKQINDSRGHAAGDSVLIRFADIIRGTLRATDVFGRIGGEEFAIVLPDTDLKAALLVAEKLRKAVETDRLKDNPVFTISIGVTPLLPADISVDGLLHRADEAMYFAKREGRNRVGFISVVQPMIYDAAIASAFGTEERKVA
jgi:diguanylate cyclase (GGDEF)-like protein